MLYFISLPPSLYCLLSSLLKLNWFGRATWGPQAEGPSCLAFKVVCVGFVVVGAGLPAPLPQQAPCLQLGGLPPAFLPPVALQGAERVGMLAMCLICQWGSRRGTHLLLCQNDGWSFT